MQPLDTHVFAMFKRRLEALHHTARIDSCSRELAFPKFMSCIYRTIEEVVTKRSWSAAFESDGFGRSQSNVSERVTKHLRLEAPLCIPEDEPALDEIAHCFPKRFRLTRDIAFGAVVQPLPRRARPLSDPVVPIGVLLSRALPGVRTRSVARAQHIVAQSASLFHPFEPSRVSICAALEHRSSNVCFNSWQLSTLFRDFLV